MKKPIDCVLIGHNEMNFDAYEKNVREMGVDSGAYKDLAKSILYINEKAHSITDIINLMDEEDINAGRLPSFNMLETFSNTIAYLGTYLHRRGKTFGYVNSFQAEKDKLAWLLTHYDVKAVAIATTLYVSVFPILEIMEFVKRHNTSAKVIIGGPFVSTQVRTQDPEVTSYVFNMIGADIYVNSSQGEATLVKLLNAIAKKESIAHIENLHYRSKDGYVITPIKIEDNKLYENTIDWRLFSESVSKHVAVRTAISCPYKCSFCGFPQHAGAYQTTDVDPIIQELDILANIGSVKSIHFVDDTFNIPKERFKNLLKAMIERGYNFKWHSYYRCQFSDDETMELMKQSGCEGVFLGIESGSDVILKNMDKAASSAQYRRGISFLKKYDIATFGCFITGFPGETRQTVNETVNFIEETGLDFYRTQQWYLEPITPIWNQKEKYGITGQSFEWSHNTMDALTARDIVDENYFAIRNSVWLPQYNFDFDNLLHLFHRGKTLEQLKNFMRVFSEGVKERFSDTSRIDVSESVLMRLKNIWRNNDPSFSTFEEDPVELFKF